MWAWHGRDEINRETRIFLLTSYAPSHIDDCTGSCYNEMDNRVSLSIYFQLGRALRFSDADTFLALYDSLIMDGLVEQDEQVLQELEYRKTWNANYAALQTMSLHAFSLSLAERCQRVVT